MKRSRAIAAFFLAAAPFLAGAETFAVRTFHAVTMDATGPVKAVLQLGDALRIVLPTERAHLQSIEVELKVPAIVAAAKEPMAINFYDAVTMVIPVTMPSGTAEGDVPLPEITATNITLRGRLLHTAPFANRVGVNLAVPYGGFVLPATPYAQVVPVTADEATTALLVYLPKPAASATVTPEMLDALLYVTVQPRMEDRGFLDLTLRFPPEKGAMPYSLYVDEKPTTEGRIPLESGVHHLSLVSDFFRNEMRTFTIERGKASRLEIELRDISPTVLVIAPDNVDVVFDDRPLLPGSPGTGTTPLLVTPGDHVLRVVINGYELLRTFHVENGRTYKIAIRLDLDIQEIR
jgi:hypothetical protein